MQKIQIFLFLLLCSTSYAQRPFSDASPQADHNAENSRILKLGYKTANEYRVSDSTIEPKEGTLIRSFEYGKAGLLSVLRDYDHDDTSTNNYEYDPLGVIQDVNITMSSQEININYVYGKKGLLDGITTSALDPLDKLVTHNGDGTIKEIDVRQMTRGMDENGETKEWKPMNYIPYEKVAYSYDKNKRPIIENTLEISSKGKSQIKYSYDASGRITNILRINISNYQTSEDFTYDTNGNLVVRVLTDGKDKSYFKFVYEK